MDLTQEIKSYQPIDIEKISKEKTVSDKHVQSVKFYNKAIESLRTGSEDIAIIELKKAVSSSPDFYEAVNLLGLCYIYTNQSDKAKELFGTIIQNENDVIKAADYLKSIGKNDNQSKNVGRLINKKPLTKAKNIVSKEPPKSNDINNDIYDETPTEYILFKKMGAQLKKPSIVIAINIISVICLIAAIVFFVSALKGPKKNDTSAGPAVNTQNTATYDKVVSENNNLKKQLSETNAKLDQIKLAADMSQVTSLYGQGKYVEAADKLLALNVKGMGADLKKQYDSIKQNVLLKAANELTFQGSSLYNNGNYTEAVKRLEKVFTLGNKWTFGDKALYILGKSYVAINDNQKGAKAFQKLIDEYPNSGYAKYAKSRLKSINNNY